MRKFLIGILLLVAIIFVFVQYKVYQINHAPEEYSYEILSAQPTGDELFITTTDGTKIRTLSAGVGDTVVLAHGFGGSIHDWNLIMPKLTKAGYHVIAFEQRGHNKSTIGKNGISSAEMAKDYVAVLEQFDIKNAVLVGHSMGGFLSMKFLLDYPEIAKKRIKALLLMATFAGDVNKDNPQNKIQIPLITNGYIESILANQTLATLFQSSFIGKPYKAIIQTALDNSKNQSYMPLIPILKAFYEENYYPRLGEIQIPAMVVVGTADKTTPAFHSIDLATKIPNASLVKIEGKGHLLNWEAPDEIVKNIIEVAKK